MVSIIRKYSISVFFAMRLLFCSLLTGYLSLFYNLSELKCSLKHKIVELYIFHCALTTNRSSFIVNRLSFILSPRLLTRNAQRSSTLWGFCHLVTKSPRHLVSQSPALLFRAHFVTTCPIDKQTKSHTKNPIVQSKARQP